MSGEYITVIGSLNYDILIRQKRLPQKGETYTADSISYEGGGKGANQAVQCAKLGVPVYMIGKVGRDTFGDVLNKNLDDYGVNTEHLGRSTCETGVGIVHGLDSGEVYASIITGANFDLSIADIQSQEQLIINSRMIIMQMEIPMPVIEYVIALAKQNGVYVLLNAAPAKPISEAALSVVDCLVVNESEASFYAGHEINNVDSANRYMPELLARVKGTVIITLGDQGSLLCEHEPNETDSARQGKYTVIPAAKAECVMETTGAGDSYIGAFACCKLRGLSNEDACKYAARVSAMTVAKVGAQGAMPYLSEVDEALG